MIARRGLRRRLAAVAATVVLVAATGCGPFGKSEGRAAALRDGGGVAAALAVAEPMRTFFAADLAFIVVGGALAGLGVKGSGLVLMGLGVATTGTGVLFVRYPWTVLVLALAAGVAASAALYDRLRARRDLARNREALAAAAEVIQNIPEGRAVKDGLKAMGGQVEEAVREVVGPIKERLRREGKIRS